MKRLTFMLLVACTLIFSGCSDDDNKGGSNLTTPAGQNDSATAFADQESAGGVGFQFTAAAKWTASVVEVGSTRSASSTPWVKLLINGSETYSGGAGKFTIQIELEPNYSGKSRSATITINCGGDKINITVSQDDKTADNKVPADPSPVTGIYLSKKSLNLALKQRDTLRATITPEAAKVKSVLWKSSNTTVATVDAAGVVTALKEGAAVITATSSQYKDVSASCELTVTKDEVPIVDPNPGGIESVEMQSKLMFVINSKISSSLYAGVKTRSDTLTKNVRWSNSNAAVAKIIIDENNGNAVGIWAETGGTTTITATSVADPTKSASCLVSVVNPIGTGSFVYSLVPDRPIGLLYAEQSVYRNQSTFKNIAVKFHSVRVGYYSEDFILYFGVPATKNTLVAGTYAFKDMYTKGDVSAPNTFTIVYKGSIGEKNYYTYDTPGFATVDINGDTYTITISFDADEAAGFSTPKHKISGTYTGKVVNS